MPDEILQGWLTRDQVQDYIERLERADRELINLASNVVSRPDADDVDYRVRGRLEGKAEGVRLALSHLWEYL